ncbi:hypothetical protein CBS101457_000309 [Exobasidium rhododendri]|nr:hypothetical protein CBS101457_000309 [Exobasidium rhododendri]
MVAKCPADNTASKEQDNFWDGDWDAHKVGWLISGAAAALTCFLALITIIGHARNYNRPLEQRQIIRVLLLAPVYAVVSFFSYRFFRASTYYELSETVYEALAIAAFLMLMLQYIGESVDEQKGVLMQKDKKKLPLPFCCVRYRPSKPYFLVLLKWSVIQYVIIRPAVTIAGIVTEYYEVYCQSTLSYKYAYVYLLGIDAVSITIALYGLIVLYVLIKDNLQGRKPLAKFLTIKLVVFFVFYQGFVFDILADRGVIKATEYWTTANISDGLSALCVSIEMILIAGLQMWAFNWGEYRIDRVRNPRGKANENGKTGIFRSLLHALNFSDYFVELWYELKFLFDRIRAKEYTRADERVGKFDIVGAFNGNEAEDSIVGNGGGGNQGYDYNRTLAAPLELTRNKNSMEMRQSNGQEEMRSARVDASSGDYYETMQSRQGLLAAGVSPARYPSQEVGHNNEQANYQRGYQPPGQIQASSYYQAPAFNNIADSSHRQAHPSQPDMYANNAGFPNPHHDPAQQQQHSAGLGSTAQTREERPGSWEPQAL